MERRNMRSWDELSMAEKADIMKLAIEGGVYNLGSIREGYNEYANGGKKSQGTWTMEDEAKYRKWRSSLPDNLRNTDDAMYDMRGAYKAGMKPALESDGKYHLQSRDPETGRILKSPLHPTYLQAIATDASMGYYPVVDNQGNTYTQTWEGNQYKKGGSIHIKPSKRGTFTAAASKHGMGVQQFASRVLAHPENYSPAMRKKANFARNAKRWKHGLGGNLFEMGGPKKPAKRNRFADMSIEDLKEIEKVNEEYWERKQKELDNRTPEQIKQMGIKADKEYRKRNPDGGETNPSLQRSAGVVMSALSDIANSTPFTSSEVAEAADNQRQEKLNKWHDIKLGMDASMTAAELAAAGYGVVRGLTHANRWLARQATQSTGQAVSREAMQNLLKWNTRVDKIDKAQVAMNTLGGAADGYQWVTADNSFDAWENGLETGANAAGVVGGMNWFRDLPYLRRIGGDKIDAVLDGLGYGAAAWDVVKNVPPLSTALENKREKSR